jgi:hypothetical protein
MLLASALDDLEKLPRVLAESGADQVVVNCLSLVTSQDLQAEALSVPDHEHGAQLALRLAEVRETAGAAGTEVHFHMLSRQPVRFQCSENIGGALVVGSDGRVGPCVFTRIPVTGNNFFYFRGRRVLHQNLSFGDIRVESLDRIRRRSRYRRFVQGHTQNNPPPACLCCLKAQPMGKRSAM